MARILIIDDDTSLLQMMKIMLERAGHSAVLAQDGHEGIVIARQEQPDMAIVDVMMPELSGYEVCRILREDPRTANIPLLILTALSQSEHREQAWNSGADDYVTKPITRDDLLTAVGELLTTGARNVPAPRRQAPPQAPGEGEKVPPPPPGFEDTASLQTQPVPEAPIPTTPAPATPARPTVTSPVPELPLVAVIGLRGGVGTTTLAINLGLGLMQIGRSCVVDLNSQSGHVAAQLQLVPPRSTWLDLINVAPGTDKRQIGSALMVDQKTGVAILAAPINPIQAQLNDQTLSYIFTVLAEGFRRIVVDLPSGTDPMTIAALRHARHVVMVAGDNPADLVTLPNALDGLNRLGLTGEQHLVLNHTRPHGVSHEAVVEALNCPLAADIPYEPAQVEALAQGKPLIMFKPGSLFSRTVLQLARQL